MKNPKISIVMAAYNSEDYIEESIQSVLCQSYESFELIIIDDGSKDRTQKIARNFEKEDKRIKYIYQNNSGRPSIARNAGLNHSKGQYLSFLDSDDTWEKTRLEEVVTKLDENKNLKIVFHNVSIMESNGNKNGEVYLPPEKFLPEIKKYVTQTKDNLICLSSEFYKYMSLTTTAIHTGSIAIAKNRLKEKSIIFNSQFTICEDSDLWIELAINNEIGYIPLNLANYRQHNNSITKNEYLFATERCRFHLHNLERIHHLLSKDELNQYKKRIQDNYRTAAWKSVSTESKINNLVKSFKISPNIKDALTIAKSILVKTQWKRQP